MAKVRTISQGTPISSEVLQDHANAINELYEQVFNQAAGVSIVTNGIAQTPVRVTQGQFYGETLAVLSNAKVTAGTPVEWSVTFNPAFADIPAVTATLMIPSDASKPAAAQEASAKITSVSASGAQGIITFPKEGDNVTLQVSVVAIGASKI